ncbi:hypothetical protein GLU26_01175 [Nanohaloarchaea archaeon]|nr:hypothetical protein [Candidatus Nanohaloarchaea archaeon]
MKVDADKLVYDARIENHSGRKRGKTHIFTPRGEYVGNTGLVKYQDDDEMEINLKVQKPDDVNWTKMLSEQEVSDVGEHEVPDFNEEFLGTPDRDDIEEYRDNYWLQLEDERYEVHLENLNSDTPATLQVLGSGDREEFVETAAEYAADLAYIEPRGRTESRSEEIWNQVLGDSFRAAETRGEEIDQEI